MSDSLDALRRVDFDWVRTLDSVWIDAEPTGGPNERLVPELIEALHAKPGTETKPGAAGKRAAGRVLVGQSGIGKTHLVGQLRREAWRSGGWFVLLDVLGLTDFWRSAALSFLTALLHTMPDGRRQSDAVLAGVARRFNVEAQVEAAFNTPSVDTRRIVDLLVIALMKVDAASALKHQDVFRALCLLRANDLGAVGLAHAWLQGYDADPAERAALGFRTPPPAPVDLVRGMSWIMGLGGPTLVALDQIDGVIDASRLKTADDLDGEPGPGLTEVLGAGLLDLHEVGGRGMTVITCLQDSWQRIEATWLASMRQRFGQPVALIGLNDRAAAAALVAGRLAPAYREAGFAPPHPTWPYAEAAIAGAAAAGMMPRTLLMRCDAFRRACLANDAVSVCDDLGAAPIIQVEPDAEPPFDLDAARRAADLAGLFVDDDAPLGEILRAAFDLYALEDDPDDQLDVASKGEPDQKIPPLHGRLTLIHRDEGDRERHVCYRALQHRNAIAFQARLRAALTASGIGARIPDRGLVIARRGAVPGGAKTGQLFEKFRAAGGRLIDPDEADLRTFAGLRDLRARAVADGRQDRFEAWVRATRPVRATGFFARAGLGADAPEEADTRTTHGERAGSEGVAPETIEPGRTAPGSHAALPAARPGAAPSTPGAGATGGREDRAVPPPPPITPPPAGSGPEDIPVGRRLGAGGEPVRLPLRLLARHTAIIAGSGSGKTVLLRRLVEEAALAGIPAIVVDPNNDLARLGDPWPERPAAFTDADAERARAYAARVETVVWTPGVQAGNPLFLSVLPDFSGIGDDPDERAQAVEMAGETLGPLAGAKRDLQRGVLAGALHRFAEDGGGDLPAFTRLLSDLPDGVSDIGSASRLAADMADHLRAAVATNPLLRVRGAVLDPRTLFHGPDASGGGPARTRISVINLAGLASEAAREDFVNRLQMTLFGWIRRNPAPRGMLYVVDEAQSFLPSGRACPSLSSGIKLVAQGRKYGLGMIVATQVPKGLHNQIVSNCTTQFFGRQSAPATIAAAQEIMAASGGAAGDIGRLGAGEFYFATERSGRPAKIGTPLCLSHHPANPPTPEEVVALARRFADRPGA